MWPKGMVQMVPVWLQIWGHAPKRGNVTRKERTQLKMRIHGEAAAAAPFKPLSLCVFTPTSQVGRRCEEDTAGLFSQLFPWPVRCK